MNAQPTTWNPTRAARIILWDLFGGDKARAVEMVEATGPEMIRKGMEFTEANRRQMEELADAIRAANPDHA
ncbi:hypothetical protein [Micromonospora coerulea]|uniref:hypothetical protein n=1 Tax=Micromonospora coerulea TaxID=47856 RepID=UPI001908FE1A|nr:hypothetical protein [Micromonospora veneta]